ncbi:hypothetical protein PAXRUDRAFT_291884 [Paxillus rubicundulus Ve08.2h10]|uniref:Peptidase C14 caspase domain-containing protein n=1 Tax=Paxillus rubicundulus Ve08.2h10 TaxID=930991 RepID=A0A0D0EAH9_9AGAM|nr:hypothetical protein PAXRUDRAFT_291884 [Paxillus rubicundulus Ve08.2h10]
MSGLRPPPPPLGRKRALLIGIQTVKGRPEFSKIQFAHRDTRAMQEFLMSLPRYTRNNIIVMLDDRKLDEKWWPTRAKILGQIDSLVKDAVENDQFFVYFSGHGLQVPCRHNTEDDEMDEVFLTGDGKNILDNVLKERLVMPLLKIKNVKLFVLFDCCHSGTMLDLSRRNQPDSRFGRIISGVINLIRPSQGIPKGIASIFRRQKTDVEPVIKAPDTGPERRQARSITFDNTTPSFSFHHSFVRVDTPEQVLEQVAAEVDSARVISLSACRDGEQAYDDNERGDTMTKFFIEALSEKYDRTWLELLEEISRRIKELSRRRTEASVSTTIDLQGSRPGTSASSAPTMVQPLDVFQKPQASRLDFCISQSAYMTATQYDKLGSVVCSAYVTRTWFAA